MAVNWSVPVGGMRRITSVSREKPYSRAVTTGTAAAQDASVFAFKRNVKPDCGSTSSASLTYSFKIKVFNSHLVLKFKSYMYIRHV